MKKAILLVAFLLSFSTLVSSQEIQKKTCLTSGKWQIESLAIGEEKEDFSDCQNSWMVFNNDGNYQLVMRKNEKKGQWKFSKDKNAIHFENEGGIDNFKIMQLTDKELLFSTIEDNIVYTMKLIK